MVLRKSAVRSACERLEKERHERERWELERQKRERRQRLARENQRDEAGAPVKPAADAAGQAPLPVRSSVPAPPAIEVRDQPVDWELPEVRQGLFSRLGERLSRSRTQLEFGLETLFLGGKKIDGELMEELEVQAE